MANLIHLFHAEQRVMCNTELGLLWGTVKEVYEDHIIVDIPEISPHMWYEEGWNLDEVYLEYNFGDRDSDDKYEQQYETQIEVEDLREASYYRDKYEIVCRINDDLSKSIDTYHKLLMMNQAEIKTLKAKIAEFEINKNMD